MVLVSPKLTSIKCAHMTVVTLSVTGGLAGAIKPGEPLDHEGGTAVGLRCSCISVQHRNSLDRVTGGWRIVAEDYSGTTALIS